MNNFKFKTPTYPIMYTSLGKTYLKACFLFVVAQSNGRI